MKNIFIILQIKQKKKFHLKNKKGKNIKLKELLFYCYNK